MDAATKIEIRNSFAADADTHLRDAEANIRAALVHVKHYTMGCEKELAQCLENLNVSRKTLFLLSRY